MNKSRYKSLDITARDPRIVEIWDESADGLWTQLTPHNNFDGSSCLHEGSCRELLRAWRTQISSGPIDPTPAMEQPRVVEPATPSGGRTPGYSNTRM
jgi:hypothetical protein